MRLGQISRKLNLRPLQIRDFIREKFQIEIETDLNTKLEDNYIEALQQKFAVAPQIDLFQQEAPKQIQAETSDDRWSKKAAEIIKAKKEAALPKDIEEPVLVQELVVEKNLVEPVIDEMAILVAEKKPEIQMESSEPIASTENKSGDMIDPFTPRRVDPDAELIKATNIKLDGPKVIGKIALPPTKKELEVAAAKAALLEEELAAASLAESETVQEFVVSEANEGETIVDEGLTTEAEISSSSKTKSDPISKKMASLQSSDDEEWSPFKDKKGIYHFSKEQKDNRRKSETRLKSAKKDDVKKRAKSTHYQQTHKPETKEVLAKKKSKKETVSKKNQVAESPVRKGVWGSFLNWLNG